MGKLTKTVQKCMQRSRREQIKLDILTHPGWEDAVDHFNGRDLKYSLSELRVPAVVQQQVDNDAATPLQETFHVLMECLETVCGISLRSQGTTCPDNLQVEEGSGKQQSNISICGPEPAAESH